MLSKEQQLLLEDFANHSDKLLKKGILRTDSFTGEIGEYIACTHFRLRKTEKVTRAVDGICEKGKRYQVKTKVVNTGVFSISLKDLEPDLFDFLVIVFLNEHFRPLKMVRIENKHCESGSFRLGSNHKNFETHLTFNISSTSLREIESFGRLYSELIKSKIIRTRWIVGDLGESYACSALGLKRCERVNQKGIDATDTFGKTYEIKTRRVYQSERRKSEVRRINNLVGKTADYLVVVTLDRTFKCSGMWIMPTKSVKNPKSANLGIVNNTSGVYSVIPSKVPGLKTHTIYKPIQEQIKKSPSISKKVKTTVKKKLTSNNNIRSTDEAIEVELPRVTTEKGKNKKEELFWYAILISVISFLVYLVFGS